jgi:HlyD family secretion protein
MLRQVRGLGTLVPEEVQWIPSQVNARVDRRIILPGAVVEPTTIILEMSNPDLENAVLEAQWQLRAAEAGYQSTQARLEKELLNQRALAADIEAQYLQSELQAETDSQLAKEGSGSELNAKLSILRAAGLKKRYEIEEDREEIYGRSVRAQLAEQQALVEQLRAIYSIRKRQVESLHVMSGITGVLQEVPVEVGEWVTPGVNLARVADPARLKAELRIAETQAKDILIGQKAEIDTRNGTVMGTVVRVDPAVQNGTVTVDVAIREALPPGARPELSVDGTIEIERLDDILYMGRPAYGQGDSIVGLFRLEEGGETATRVQVRLGRSSVTTIEVIDGLRENDQVILSDMSAYDAVDRVRLR